MYKIDAVVPVGDGKKLFFCYFRKYFFRFRAIQTFTKFDAKIQSLREKLRKYVFLVFFLRNFLLYSTILREVFWPAWGWRHSGEIMPKPRVAFPESHFKIRERRFSRHRASHHINSQNQCCGSGSALDPYSEALWIRIRIRNTVLLCRSRLFFGRSWRQTKSFSSCIWKVSYLSSQK